MMISKGVEDINIRMPKDAYDTGKDMPTFNAYLTVIVRDSKGNVIKVHRQRSHSPTLNFITIMLPVQYYMNTNTSGILTGLTGTADTYQPLFSNSSLAMPYPNSAANYPSYLVGIEVGNGQQSNPLTATNLASPIANGSGTGQLLYGAISVSSNITVSGNSAYFYVSQTFANQSGGTVTITEVGIVTNIQPTQANNGAYITIIDVLVWYDALSSSISIPNGGSITIYYTFTVNP
jgi:hypothetical protein